MTTWFTWPNRNQAASSASWPCITWHSRPSRLEDDECYRLFIDWLPFETTQGRQTVRSLREENKVLRYVDDVAQYHQMEKVAAAQGFTLVNAGYVYEAELLSRLPEVYPDVALEQVDPAALTQDFEELDLAEQDQIHELLAAAADVLRPFRCQPEARKFKPADLPALFSAGAEARFLRSLEQSKETADPLFQGVLGSLESGRTKAARTELVFNFHNPLIQRLTKLKTRSVLMRAVEVLYVQGLLLAHQPLSSRELGILTQGLAGLLDALVGPAGTGRPRRTRAMTNPRDTVAELKEKAGSLPVRPNADRLAGGGSSARRLVERPGAGLPRAQRADDGSHFLRPARRHARRLLMVSGAVRP